MQNVSDSIVAEEAAWRAADWATRKLIQKRVDRGERLLDARIGNVWPFHMNLDRLDLDSSCRCVLGQLAVDIVPKRQWLRGRYRRFTPDYAESLRALNLSDAKARSHGFLGDFKRGITGPALAYCWRRRIRSRAGDR